MQDTIATGTTLTINGVHLTVHAFDGHEYEIWSTRGPGVWFASPAQLRAALAG